MSAIRKRRPLDLVDRIRDQALAAKRQRVPVVEEAAASPADSTAENSTPDSGLRRSARLRTRTASPISYRVPEEDEVEVVEGATPGLQALNERNRLPSQRRAKGSGTRRGKARARKDAEDVEPPRSAGSQRGTARKGKARQPAVAPAPASTTAGSTPSPAPKREKKSAEKEGTRSSRRRGGNSLPEVECYPLDAVESEMALSRFDVGTEQLGETGKDGTTLLVTDLETGEKLAMKQFKKAKSGAMVRKEAMAQAQAAAQGAAPAVIGFRTSGAVKFIVMRKMERTVKEALKDGSWMPSDEAQIIRTLELMDKAGVKHGDRSPLNFMQDSHGVWYAIDFGMAKVVKSGADNSSPLSLAILLRAWNRVGGVPGPKLAALVPRISERAAQQSSIPVPGLPFTPAGARA